MRILWASKGWHPLDQLIAHTLVDQGHDVALFTLAEVRDGWQIPVYGREVPTPATPVVGPTALGRAARKHRADVVFGNFATTYGNYAVRGAPRGVPAVVLAWGSDVLLHGAKPGWSVLTKKALRGADAVVANASHLATAATALGARDVQVLPYGIDAQTFTVDLDRPTGWPEEAGGPWLVCNRNLKPLYDHATLLRGLATLERDPGPRLLLTSAGPEREPLERLATELGIEDRVVFTGRLPYDELPNWLGSCSVWLSAAHSDGLPLSMLEGMACGLKVVVGELPYVADWRIEGVTFPFRIADAADCARAIGEALDAPDLAGAGHPGRAAILERGDVRRTAEGLVRIARQAGAAG